MDHQLLLLRVPQLPGVRLPRVPGPAGSVGVSHLSPFRAAEAAVDETSFDVRRRFLRRFRRFIVVSGGDAALSHRLLDGNLLDLLINIEIKVCT